jgi:hypothetical protein
LWACNSALAIGEEVREYACTRTSVLASFITLTIASVQPPWGLKQTCVGVLLRVRSAAWEKGQMTLNTKFKETAIMINRVFIYLSYNGSRFLSRGGRVAGKPKDGNFINYPSYAYQSYAYQIERSKSVKKAVASFSPLIFFIPK